MRTDWKFNMEPIIFGWRKDGKHKWYGDQKQKAVFEFDESRIQKRTDMVILPVNLFLSLRI